MKKFDRVEIVCIVAVALMVVFGGLTFCSILTEGTVKAETYEPEEPLGITFEEPNESAIALIDESRGIFVIVEPNEPKTYTAEELDEIYKDEPALGRLAKSMWGLAESNEPTAWDDIGEPDVPGRNESEYKWFCSCGKGIRKMSIYECRDCGKVYNPLDVILKNIPTWPDYIELEKDLVIDLPDDHSIGIYEIILGKGTKIYFKE